LLSNNPSAFSKRLGQKNLTIRRGIGAPFFLVAELQAVKKNVDIKIKIYIITTICIIMYLKKIIM